MRSFKKGLTFAAALGLAAVLGMGGCGPQGNVVKIAAALPLTGDIAGLGQGIKRAIAMAVQEANASGRFPNYKIVLEEYDDRSDPKEAVSVANRIASDPKIVAVIGHFNSGCSIPAAAVYARAHLPMITPAASNPELTRQQLSPQWTWPKNVFRTNTTDDVQGAIGARFAAKDLNLSRVAIVHDKTAYGQGVAEEFRNNFQKLGGRVLSFDGIQVGDKDFKALLTRIKALSPQALYFGGLYNEGGLLVRQARDAGLEAVFFTCEANYDPEFLKISGPAAEGAYVTFLGSPPDFLPTAKAFIENYKKAYPDTELKAYDHYGYEAVSVALAALSQAGPDRDKMIEVLHGLKHEGILGLTAFDAKGDTLNKTISVFQVKDGKFKLLSVQKS